MARARIALNDRRESMIGLPGRSLAAGICAWQMVWKRPGRAGLLVVQFLVSAMILMLVTALAAGTAREVRLLSRVFGYNTAGVWQAAEQFSEGGAVRVMGDADVAAIQELPGVQAVVGVREYRPGYFALAPGRGLPGSGDAPSSPHAGLPAVYGVTPGFLPFFQLRLAEGRAFTADEADSGSPVAVVTREVLEILTAPPLPGEEALGRVLEIGHPYEQPVQLTIVGVLEQGALLPGHPHPAADPQVHAGRPVILVPARLLSLRLDAGDGGTLSHVWLRAGARSEDAASLAANAAALLASLHTGARFDYCWKTKQVQDELATVKPILLVLGLFGLAALALGAFGLAGIILATLAQRYREIGLRQALGATRTDVMVQIVLEASIPAALGVLGSLVVALTMLRFSQTLGLGQLESWGVLVGMIVAVVAFIAPACLGARAVARSAPWESLRHD